MRPVIRTTCKAADRRVIAAQFVCDDNAWRAKAINQALQKTLGRLRVTLFLNQNIKNIAVGIDGPPQPEISPIDRDNDFVEMPFVVGSGPIPFHAFCKVRPKPVDPFSDSLTADHHTPLCQKILDIGGAEGKPVAGPNSKGNDFTWETEALQARHLSWLFHHEKLSCRKSTIKLAMPSKVLLIGDDGRDDWEKIVLTLFLTCVRLMSDTPKKGEWEEAS